MRTLVGAAEPDPEPVFGGILATTTRDTPADQYGPDVTPYLAAGRATTVPLTTSITHTRSPE